MYIYKIFTVYLLYIYVIFIVYLYDIFIIFIVYLYNIYCVFTDDHSRVVLVPEIDTSDDDNSSVVKNENSDYINASYFDVSRLCFGIKINTGTINAINYSLTIIILDA